MANPFRFLTFRFIIWSLTPRPSCLLIDVINYKPLRESFLWTSSLRARLQKLKGAFSIYMQTSTQSTKKASYGLHLWNFMQFNEISENTTLIGGLLLYSLRSENPSTPQLALIVFPFKILTSLFLVTLLFVTGFMSMTNVMRKLHCF